MGNCRVVEVRHDGGSMASKLESRISEGGQTTPRIPKAEQEDTHHLVASMIKRVRGFRIFGFSVPNNFLLQYEPLCRDVRFSGVVGACSQAVRGV